MKSIRTLKPSEIEIRVQQVNDSGTGCSLLLYKNARADMEILDETFGPGGWQRHHEMINNNLYCTISIWDDEKKEWIKKQDVGTEGNYEKEKSQATDSFKRAAVNVGIGRELYSAPFIWIKLRRDEIEEVNNQYNNQYNKNNSKYRLNSNTKFFVNTIKYSPDKKIIKLIIVDQNGECRFSFNQVIPQNELDNRTHHDTNYYKDNSYNKEELPEPPVYNYESRKELADKMQIALNTLINFGKHKGQTLGDLKQADPQYLKWLSENTKNVQLKDACDTIIHA